MVDLIKNIRLKMLISRISSMSDADFCSFLREISIFDAIILVDSLPYKNSKASLTLQIFDKKEDLIKYG